MTDNYAKCEFNNWDGVEPFTGTVDELLEHCGNVSVTDWDDLDEDTQDEWSMMAIGEALDELMADGKVEIVGHNADGDPLYGLVEEEVDEEDEDEDEEDEW